MHEGVYSTYFVNSVIKDSLREVCILVTRGLPLTKRGFNGRRIATFHTASRNSKFKIQNSRIHFFFGSNLDKTRN